MELEIGQKLRNSREAKNISLELLSRKLNIKKEYLLAIEEGLWHKLPAGLYAKNYIKEYARLMKIPYGEIKKKLSRGLITVNDHIDPFSKKVLQRKEFFVFPKLIKNIVLALIFFICLLYLAFYFKKIVVAPEIIIYQPDRNIKTTSNAITIEGKTEAEADVTINGEAVLNNNNGHFVANVKLKSGVNNLLIKAKKKYSGEASILRQILVEP